MIFFRKRRRLKKANATGNIAEVCSRVAVLLEICDSDEIKLELNSLHDEIKFAYPSDKEEVIIVEKKIIVKLEDLKIMLSAGKRDKKVAEEIKEVKVLLAERTCLV